MDRYLVVKGFNVFVPARDADGRQLKVTVNGKEEDAPERRVEFPKGRKITEADVPANQSLEDWLDKGLVERTAATD